MEAIIVRTKILIFIFIFNVSATIDHFQYWNYKRKKYKSKKITFKKRKNSKYIAISVLFIQTRTHFPNK